MLLLFTSCFCRCPSPRHNWGRLARHLSNQTTTIHFPTMSYSLAISGSPSKLSRRAKAPQWTSIAFLSPHRSKELGVLEQATAVAHSRHPTSSHPSPGPITCAHRGTNSSGLGRNELFLTVVGARTNYFGAPTTIHRSYGCLRFRQNGGGYPLSREAALRIPRCR